MTAYAAGTAVTGAESAMSSDRLENMYCGLYCIYAAARLAGVECKFAGLLTPKYVGSPAGSSLAELVAAAEDHGLSSKPISGLGVDDLGAVDTPIALHVLGSTRSIEPDHFVLLLETIGRDALVFDPPTGFRGPRIQRVPLPVLAARWRGRGLALQTGETAIRVDDVARRWPALASVLVGAGALLFGFVARGRGELWRGALPVGIGLVLVVSFAAALASPRLTGRGLRWSEPTRYAAGLLHEQHFTDSVDAEQLPKLLKDPAVVFIDAREPEQHRHMNIPGSRNVPFGTGRAERDRALGMLTRDTRIITYCDPNGCPIAARFARVLEDDGFRNVQFLEGNWTKWIQDEASAAVARGDET